MRQTATAGSVVTERKLQSRVLPKAMLALKKARSQFGGRRLSEPG